MWADNLSRVVNSVVNIDGSKWKTEYKKLPNIILMQR